MKDRDLDDILKGAAGRLPEVEPNLVDRISASMEASLQPVRPLPAPWILIAGLIAICAAIAIGGAMALGPHGIQKMSALQAGLIFPALAVMIFAAARISFAEMIPGSRRPVTPWVMSVAGCVALAVIFGLLFSDYATERFVSQGMTCLTAGMLHALPVVIGSALLLRRGFAVNPAAAWFAKGTLAGLAGVTMLELHCANFEAPHILVWHIAVLPLGGAMGAAVAWMMARRPGERH